MGYLVRTMTAVALSPLFTSPVGRAFFTATRTRSPTPMATRVNFPRAVLTPMMPITMASLAPLLSQTSSRDSF